MRRKFHTSGYVLVVLTVLFWTNPLAASAQTLPTLESESDSEVLQPDPQLELDPELDPEVLQLDQLEPLEQLNPETDPEASELDQLNQLNSYVLGPGDTINIAVFAYDEYTGDKVIFPDGTITLPLVGSVTAAGLTTEQLAQELTLRLQSLLVNPVVTVQLTTLRPVTVTVAGEVRRPGPLELVTGEEFTENVPTLSEALVAAGGITQDADIRQVTVRRRIPNGETQSIVVNLWDAIASEDVPSDIILQEGDSVFVPRLTADAQIDRRLIARSSFAPETVRVRVIGEVNSPGEIGVPPDSTISSAVAIAGGPTDDARLSRVAFIRMNESGEIERQVVDLRNLIDSYQIQEGDVIIVPEDSTSEALDIASRFIIDPLNSILGLFTGINRLIGGR
ncbi:MAG: polysaccharide export protein [Cyanobacteria bacterium CRU_2_1]|nr:polysaccharide export protein [Cyanobacteria bacterium CRU_2_1]